MIIWVMVQCIACSSSEGRIDDFHSNMCNRDLITRLIGPISNVFMADTTQDYYIPKVAGNSELHFCTENLDFTCCDSKMLYNAFHKKSFKTGLRKFQALKGKIIKIYRIFQLLKSVNYSEKIKNLISDNEDDLDQSSKII